MKLFIITIFSILSPNFTQAQSLVLTENQLAPRIRAQNPDLRAAKWQINEAIGRMAQEGKPSRPRLDVEWENGAHMRENSLSIGFSRSFPLTKKLQARQSIALQELHAAENEVLAVEQKLLAAAREAFFTVLASREKAALLTQQQQAAQDYATSLGKSAAKGETPTLDATQAELDSKLIALEISSISASRTTAETTLKSLLGLSPDASISVSGSLEMTAAGQGNITSKAEYAAATDRIAAARDRLALEWQHNRYNDLEAGVYLRSERSEDAPKGYDRDTSIGLQFSIPLPFWNDNSGAIATARAEVNRRTDEARAIAENAHQQAKGGIAEMNQWRKMENDLSNKTIPLAQQQLQQAEAAYKAGQSDISAIFRARSQLKQLLVARIDVLQAYHNARLKAEAALPQ